MSGKKRLTKRAIYKYNAKVVRVVDGDTVDAAVDLGFGITYKIKIRLSNFSAPEIRGNERLLGLKVKAMVEKLVLDKDVVIETIKTKDKYGRYLAKLFIDGEVLGEGLIKLNV